MNGRTFASSATPDPVDAFELACLAFSTPRRIAATETEQALLAQATKSTHQHAGQEIAVWTLGNGPRVLLVHGWDSRGSHLAAFVEPLLRVGFSITLFDMPAHGDSAGQHGSVVHAAKALLSLSNTLGEIHAVITHSMGSAAALIAFCQGLQVQASVHLSGPSSLSAMVQLQALGHGLNPEQSHRFHRWVETFIGQTTRSVDLESLLDGLRHRALIIHDPADRVVPVAASIALNQAWSNSELIQVHGLGHRRILTDDDVVIRSVAHIAQSLPRDQSA